MIEKCTCKIEFRLAVRNDLEQIVSLLRDDALGVMRESQNSENLKAYEDAFQEISSDPKQRLIVATMEEDVVGTLQISFLRHLVRCGVRRAQIEGVRVSNEFRGKGIGRALLLHAIEIARDEGCMIVQLTSDKTRTDAQNFYGNLGFEASHEGLKLDLSGQ